MTEKQFWMKMDQLSESKQLDLAEKAIQLANLIILAYKEDKDLFISAAKMPDGQYHQNVVCGIPGNPNATGSRFLVCYKKSVIYEYVTGKREVPA